MPVDSDDDFDRHAKVVVTIIDMNTKTNNMYDVFIVLHSHTHTHTLSPNNFRSTFYGFFFSPPLFLLVYVA